jgi:hypothetical protein
MSSTPIFFAPLKVPVTDPQTGLMTRDWYLFFQSIYIRVGGVDGTTIVVNPDLLQDPPGAGTAEFVATQFATADALGQVPVSIPGTTFDDVLGELRQTRDLVAELIKRIQDLQQGTVTI